MSDRRGWALVEVQDNGAAPHVFAPFFTTTPLGVGTGSALSPSQSVVNGFGGEGTFVSKTGSGATFRVALPPADNVEDTLPRSIAYKKAFTPK